MAILPAVGHRRRNRRFSDRGSRNGVSERPRARSVVSAVVLSGLAALILAVALAVSYSPMTPYDEQAHFDYVVRLVDEHRLFPVGEMYSQTTLREITCRGIGLEKSGKPRTECGPQLTKPDLPFEGVNYVAGYSPLFFGLTALVAAPLSSVGGISLFLAARLVCAMWFALGAGMLSWALMRLGSRPGLAVGSSVLLASTPAFVLQGGAVTPDSVSLAVGAASLLIVTLRTTWGRRMALATVVGVLIALAKSSFVPLATFTVLLAMVFPMRGANGQARWLDLGWKRLTGGLALAAVPVVVTGLNSMWRSASLAPGATADGGMNAILRTDASLWTEIVRAGIQLLQPLEAVVYISPPLWVAIAVLLQTIVLGGAVVVAIQPYLPFRGATRTIAFGALGSWLVAAVFLPTTFYVLFHVEGTQGRYALPLMPLFLAAVVLAIKDARFVRSLVGVAAGAGWTVALLAVLAA